MSNKSKKEVGKTFPMLFFFTIDKVVRKTLLNIKKFPSSEKIELTLNRIGRRYVNAKMVEQAKVAFLNIKNWFIDVGRNIRIFGI